MKELGVRKCEVVSLRLCLVRVLAIVKAEGYRVIYQKVDKAINNDVVWSCRGVIKVALHNDVLLCLHICLATWITTEGIREEALIVLANGGIAYGHVMSRTCRVGAEWPGVERSYSRIEGIWQQKWRNNLGLSSCAVPQSTVACVVAYFRRTELLPGVPERSGIDW